LTVTIFKKAQPARTDLGGFHSFELLSLLLLF
jgi:hypothetical protein